MPLRTALRRIEKYSYAPRFGALAFLLVFAPVLASGAGGKLDISRILQMRTLGSVKISPDGSLVAFVVKRLNDEARSKEPHPSELWIVPADGGNERRITDENLRVSSVEWAPSGSRLAVLATSGDSLPQIYLVDPKGGPARKVTEPPAAPSTFRWAPDGTRIAYTALVTESADPATKRRWELGYDAIEVVPRYTVDRPRRNGVWIVDVASGRTNQVDTGAEHVMDLDWSPDSQRFLLTVSETAHPDDQRGYSHLVSVPSAGGETQDYCPDQIRVTGARWAPDGKAALFLGSLNEGTDFFPGGLLLCPGPGHGAARNIVEGSSFAVENFELIASRNSLLVTAAKNAQRYLALLDLDTAKVTRLIGPPWHAQYRSGHSASRDGVRIAGVLAASTQPPDVWLLDPDGKKSRLTTLNPELSGLTLGEGERVQWKAPDGLTVSGVLIKPAGYQPTQRYPLVIHLHGSNMGEANDFQMSSVHWGQFLAANGYAVLAVNFRGSLMGSYEFRRAARGDYGGKDLEDVLAGADAMVSRGIADPDHIGVSGISYGGYLTALAATATTRFQAAVMASGIANWFTFHTGQTATPSAVARLEWGRSPYEIAGFLWGRSPSAMVSQAKTPMLILWGEKDPGSLVSQALELFRGLRHFGVPSKLVVFPREGHVLSETNHLRQYYEMILEWFDKYLKAPQSN